LLACNHLSERLTALPVVKGGDAGQWRRHDLALCIGWLRGRRNDRPVAVRIMRNEEGLATLGTSAVVFSDRDPPWRELQELGDTVMIDVPRGQRRAFANLLKELGATEGKRVDPPAFPNAADAPEAVLRSLRTVVRERYAFILGYVYLPRRFTSGSRSAKEARSNWSIGSSSAQHSGGRARELAFGMQSSPRCHVLRSQPTRETAEKSGRMSGCWATTISSR